MKESTLALATQETWDQSLYSAPIRESPLFCTLLTIVMPYTPSIQVARNQERSTELWFKTSDDTFKQMPYSSWKSSQS